MSRRLSLAVKRAVDVIVAGAVFLVTLSLQVVIAIAVRLRMGSPVLFRQERPGKDGRPFEMVKFRTMLNPDDRHQSDEERMTKLGAFLRATSLDELPTLLNVLRGDMSLVGPRPLLPEYLPLYTPRQSRRHEMRPGVTGLAQVKGRNSVDWAERLAWDVYYVDNFSLKLDAKVLVDTVAVVLRRDGISEEGQATMTDFEGAPDVAVGGVDLTGPRDPRSGS